MIHLYVKLFTGIIESFTITPLKIIELKYLRYSIHQGNLVHKHFCTEFIDYLLRLIKLVLKPVYVISCALTDLENKAIDEAEGDLHAGNVITDEEANEQIVLWL